MKLSGLLGLMSTRPVPGPMTALRGGKVRASAPAPLAAQRPDLRRHGRIASAVRSCHMPRSMPRRGPLPRGRRAFPQGVQVLKPAFGPALSSSSNPATALLQQTLRCLQLCQARPVIVYGPFEADAGSSSRSAAEARSNRTSWTARRRFRWYSAPRRACRFFAAPSGRPRGLLKQRSGLGGSCADALHPGDALLGVFPSERRLARWPVLHFRTQPT